ncbi:MAG: M24 family metallopeptidase [Planctomycetota bacterium]|nr:MAG: M24 family metallopeptidase [Planctomycetota bacterium]
MFDLAAVQTALRQYHFAGWLLAEFRGSNVLARRILGMGEQPLTSRRFLYWIPAEGPPVKIVHRIEESVLDHLPGDKVTYLKWQEFEAAIRGAVAGRGPIAMEYSPGNGNPYISKVDAGTIDLVRGCGASVVSSGNLIQLFESTWDAEQERMHFEAAQITNAAYEVAWKFIASQVRQHGQVQEVAVQQAIMDHFLAHGATTYSPPIVGRGPHSALPHYETGDGPDTLIREGDFVLVDLWAKLNQPRAVYSDLTRTGFVGTTVPEQFTKVFQVVAAARDAGIACVQEAFAAGHELSGGTVDDAVRTVIERAGYGPYFTHRTGHNIGQEVHGNGAHIDNLESREDRLLMRRTCFSIEPGIYLPGEFGVRSEIDVYIDATGQVHVTGGELQRSIVAIMNY